MSSSTATRAAAVIDLTDETSEPKKKAKQKRPTEKRAKRFRSSCPGHLMERLERAASQRLYLIEKSDIDDTSTTCDFVVLGSTGNVYTVTLDCIPTCTCPDFAKREDLCKHIMFVLLKVIGLPLHHSLSYQKAYLTQEVRQLLDMVQSRRVGGVVLANEQVRRTFAHKEEEEEEEKSVGGVQRRSLDNNTDCPICFDPMNELAETTHCRAQCGANFHADCIRRWCRQQAKATCPNCRQPWSDNNNESPKKRNAEGYVNLGQLQGQSPVRDTSTYYHGPYSPYGKRPRWR